MSILSTCIISAPAFSKPLFKLRDPGTEKTVDYEQYGSFSGIGTFDYAYTITDREGLAKASGEGIDPNADVRSDPAYAQVVKEGRLRANPWKHIEMKDPQADFFAWAATTKADPGTRLYFEGRALEAAGLYEHALKAYRAAMILYPRSYCWNRAHTATWLVAPIAWGAILNLTRMHPETGLKLVDAFVETKASIDGNPEKNRVAVTPGRFIPYTAADRKESRIDIGKLLVVQRRGGRVACVKYSNGQWGLQVDGKPYIVKGITYMPAKVGQGYFWNWMTADEDRNGRIDTAYDTWVDANRNGKRDPDEPVVGDFQLLKEMGCNTIRIFNSLDLNKELLRDLHKRYGIRVLLGDFFGAYTVHSLAGWNEGTDYTHEDQRRLMKEAVLKTVAECKDEPWLLGYLLGNENNMPSDYTGVNATRTRAASQPKEYALFLNEVAAEIHKLDPEHPVGVGNMGLGLVDYYAKYAPELDFIGVNDYPGPNGFGALWMRAKRLIDRPVLITEYGCDAYWTGRGVDEEAQAAYLANGWNDIAYNTAGEPGEGNAIGGIIFEWLDEWWKDPADPLDSHTAAPTMEQAFPDGWSQEEWYGVASQGKGMASPFLRQLRSAYQVYRRLWHERAR